ncbi:MAG: hypothetical protein NPIRA02_41380 [Nitrospirales bacterium]|nr:MAG: hypothetical protein NPIRA02_41380 [Nitrospirales bacterium]
MEASVVDLRYNMHDVLKALDRKEEVTILYRGKVKGKILPAATRTTRKVRSHPFFGMACNPTNTVLEELEVLRNARTRAI